MSNEVKYELTDKGLLELYVGHKVREDRHFKLYQSATKKDAYMIAEKHLIKMKNYALEAKVLESKILDRMSSFA